jgi:hypothetical protein
VKRAGALAAAAILTGTAAWLGSGVAEPPGAELEGKASLVASGIVAADTDADGNSVVVRIAEVRRTDGRIGFVQSPLLEGLELRGVRVTRNGRVLFQRRKVEIPGLWSGPRSEARSVDPIVARVHQLAGLRPLLEAAARP